MDDGPGECFAQCEKQYAQKPYGKDHEPHVRQQENVGDYSGKGKSVEIVNDERKQQNVYRYRNQEGVFKLRDDLSRPNFPARGREIGRKLDPVKLRIDDDYCEHACKRELEGDLRTGRPGPPRG